MNYTFKSFSVMSKIYLANLCKPRKMKCYYDMDPNSDDSDDPDWVPSKNKAQCNNGYNNAADYQSSGLSSGWPSEWSEFSPRSSSGSSSGWPSGCTSDC